MKFKRTIASILTVTFSLTLMGTKTPITYANDDFEATLPNTAEDMPPQEEINEKLKELDKQGQLDELKEQIRKLEEKIKAKSSEYKNKKDKKKKSKNKEKENEEDNKDEKNEESYFSKSGIKNVLDHPFKILFSGTITLISEAILKNLPLISGYMETLLGTYNLVIFLPLIIMLSTAFKLYENGCKKDKQKQQI